MVFIIYRVLLVYVGVGLARWMCRHTFGLVRGRRPLKRAGGSQLGGSQLPATKFSRSTVALIKFASRSLTVKIHQEKTAIKKNSTVIDREFDSLSITVEFFGLRRFSLGALLQANFC